MTSNQDEAIEYYGTVWEKDGPYIIFTLMAHDDAAAMAEARARFGDKRRITLRPMRDYSVIDYSIYDQERPSNDGLPFKEYHGKLWVDGEPVVRFTLMARDPDEAYLNAKAKYGDHRYSIWNEEDRHKLR